MEELKPCPICGKKLKESSPEDWKPSFYDPDSGGDPYLFYCECGYHFYTDEYIREKAIQKANRRPDHGTD